MAIVYSPELVRYRIKASVAEFARRLQERMEQQITEHGAPLEEQIEALEGLADVGLTDEQRERGAEACELDGLDLFATWLTASGYDALDFSDDPAPVWENEDGTLYVKGHVDVDEFRERAFAYFDEIYEGNAREIADHKGFLDQDLGYPDAEGLSHKWARAINEETFEFVPYEESDLEPMTVLFR